MVLNIWKNLRMALIVASVMIASVFLMAEIVRISLSPGQTIMIWTGSSLTGAETWA